MGARVARVRWELYCDSTIEERLWVAVLPVSE